MSADADEPAGTRGRRLLLVGVAALAVLALALGAAALDDARLSSSGGTGGPESTYTPAGDATDEVPTGPPKASDASMSPWYFLAIYVLAVVATLLIGWHRQVRTVYLLVGAVLATALLVVLLFGQVPELRSPTNGSAGEALAQNDSSIGGGGGSTPGEAPPSNALPTEFLLYAGLALGIAVIVGFSRKGPSETDDGGEEQTEDAAERVADVGDAAGRAADSLAATDLENAVYRAWRDMTDALDVPATETTTPAEFRDAAVAAGLPERPVEDLTTVFREVRYGDAPTTPDRREAAREALRDVETAAAALTADETTGSTESTAEQSAESTEGET